MVERRRGRPSEAESRVIDARVLEAAFVAFRTLGFEATQMEKVAAEAGITKASLYRRFASKGELLAQVVLNQSAWISETMPLLTPDDDPIGRLKALMWSYRRKVGEERPLAAHRLALATLHGEPAVRDAMADVRRRYVAPVDVLVEAARSRGRLPPLPTEELREILFSLLVNDAADLPLHGYPDAIAHKQAFANRWAVFEHGLLRAQPD